MIIRHAEKPGIKYEPPMGFDEEGRLDLHSLTVRGWQRAGALVKLFQPDAAASSDSSIEEPAAIYAAKQSYEGENKERLADDEQHAPGDEEGLADSKAHLGARALQTVLPLAQKLGLTEGLDTYGLTQEADLVAKILQLTKPVLIAWEHKRITDIVSALQPGAAPIHWNRERFDMVWIFAYDGTRYRLFVQPQNLLVRDEERIDDETSQAATTFNA